MLSKQPDVPETNTYLHLIVWLLIIFVSIQKVDAQTNSYSISHGGKEIGEITASLLQHGTKRTYEVKSNVDFKVLWKNYNRKTSNFVVFDGLNLIHSISDVYMNDDLQDSTRIDVRQNKYECYRYPDEQFEMNDFKGLNFSTVQLYFQEPTGIGRIYSERFLDYCILEKIGNHKYKLRLPNGKVNLYTYREGRLSEVIVDRGWFTLRFKKK
ncbi:MAG: DUF6134 family protein [Bacteroidota bacterium]